MKILLALSLVALVGCAGRPAIRGVRFNADGTIVNATGRDLHQVKLWGDMWTHGTRIELLPGTTFRLGQWTISKGPRRDWANGVTIPLPWPYRMESVDRLDLRGSCDEGKFLAVFPNPNVASVEPPEPKGREVTVKEAKEQFPHPPRPDWCAKCESYHWPENPHEVKPGR